MMEVKQNTSVDLNELLTLAKDSGTDEVDDGVMTDITDGTHDLVNCNLIKPNDEKRNITEHENGVVAMTSLIKDIDVDEDLSTTVNSELEDALLAEDDVLPNIQSPKMIEPSLSASHDILAEKAETSNSTTSSNIVRDPGDDLDTLLSKINDIVEDCIEKENENAINNTMKSDPGINKIVQDVQEDVLSNEGLLLTEEVCVGVDESKLVEDDKVEETANENSKKLECSAIGDGNLNEKEVVESTDLMKPEEIVLNSSDELRETESDNLNDEEKDEVEAETNVVIDKDTNQLNSTENKTESNFDTENLNIEKTEESNSEIVQDNKMTSCSNEACESVKTPEPATIENNEIIANEHACDSDELKKTLRNIEDTAIATKNSTLETEKINKSPNEDPTVAGSVENDDSDDEIVFYVDKPPEKEKSKETESKDIDSGREIDTKISKPIPTKETSSQVKKTDQDDDVVLLLDDDDEDIDQMKKDSNKKEIAAKGKNDQNVSPKGIVSAELSEIPKKKDIVIDNSDNACDDFETINSNENEKRVDKPEVTETAEETNSNCSSSSNLLQESKSAKNSVDEPILEEAEIEEEEDDGEVELIESELKDTEILEKPEETEISPPAKRMRLSEDGEKSDKHESGESDEVESLNVVEKKSESEESLEKGFLSTQPKLKRSHDVIELEVDEKSNDSKASQEGNNNKKAKTGNLNDDVVICDTVNEIKDFKDSENKNDVLEGIKCNMKAVPSYDPIRLYPAPKFGGLKSGLPMSLDFLKKFRKSFDNMTKQDLEDLVLQKVVEAIIHRSEFSEMRELIEKQEKIINAHRSKISELSKQFRDLEMVHNRVVKDIEQRNSQFIMPVKITRAVGLQVYIPNKKSLGETTSTSTGPSISSSPQRPVSSQASSTSSTSLTPPQRQLLTSQSETQQQRTTGITSTGPGNSGIVRRGCVQKITPIRPVPGANQPISTGSTAMNTAAYRNTPTLPAPTQPRILNKNAATAVNATAVQRSRYLGSNQEAQRMGQQQQISRTNNTPTNSQRVAANSATQSKPTSNIVTSVQRRAEPLPSQTANNSSSIVDNYINTLTHLSGANTAVSITPAKPKEKAVIDLTDEDETPGQSAATQLPGTHAQRRIMPAQNNSSSSLQYGRPQPPMGRVPPSSQAASNKNRQISSLQGAQKNNTFTSINTPPGTSITRINVAPNAQRVKYSHPAPLPATPPQAFNPSWKLPPPRPTIRISNLDNGIVISWTMEESMDRHAECVSYQIYAYQETSGPPMVDSWRHVGDVKAMLLPMAVTLTQFQEGQRYYFAVRAVDCHQRYGPFSLPKTWS